MSSLYAVIMAGGVGSRFWPKSRERSPKQLLEILGEGTMIQQTIRRLESKVPPMNTFIVTNVLHQDQLARQLPFLPKENIIVEPVGRNTAPCIGLAALWINRVDPDGVMIVLPADHLIRNQERFLEVLMTATSVAESSRALVTIGIRPTHPETGFGYIQYDDSPQGNPYHGRDVYTVKTFAEKPNLETAERFLASGDFLWNSGMFMWKASVILEEIQRHLPDLHAHLMEVQPTIGTPAYRPALEQAYGKTKGISIDYGVMERAAKVYVLKGDFGWSDVGSWDEVARLSAADDQLNSTKGTVIMRDSRNVFVDASHRVVAAIGVDDIIIIETPNAVLVCRKGRSQDVKEIVDYLRRKQMNDQL
ncbi:MAG: mannose-1-phosphate guanylyltransferase [Bacteroidetes bacterium]|jgi:mannose-1-phosphate guanylyltransferase|nr:mannose-1-phosphate guanylyltransferase [Bacteroidota bacterium]